MEKAQLLQLVRMDLVRYGSEGSSVSKTLPAWARLSVRVATRYELHAIVVYRYGHWAVTLPIPRWQPWRFLSQLWRFVHLSLYFVLNKVCFIASGISIAMDAHIDGGLFFPHP